MEEYGKRIIPLTRPYFGQEEYQNVEQVLKSGWVAQGLRVAEFEQLIAAHEESSYAIAVSSCTTALHLALLAHGIGPGMDVIAPSFTFVATANAIEYTGATAVLADIRPNTFNIDPDSIRAIIHKCYHWDQKREILVHNETGNQLKALMPVHQFGLCADMPEIMNLAEKYHLAVIEDAACALGARIEGVHQGKFGNIRCVSFHPRKCITTGEGGMLLTDSEEFGKKLKALRSHCATQSEVSRHTKHMGFLMPEYPEVGYNYRMSDIQAAVGCAQAKKLDDILEKRKQAAKNYDELLTGFGWLKIPVVPEGYHHTYQSYVCMMDFSGLSIEKMNEKRNRIMTFLEERGIQTRQGTHAVHMLGYYKGKYGYKDEDLIHSYRADRLSIALPLYADISLEDQKYVVEMLAEGNRKS